MPSIGGRTVTVFDGRFRLSKVNYRLFEQGGVDGFGVVFGAYKNPVSPVRTVTRFGSSAAASTEIDNYRALMKTAVSVVDQFAGTWSNVVVLGVICDPSLDPLGWFVTAQWELLPTSGP